MKRFIFFTILGLAFSHFAFAAIQRDTINNDAAGYLTGTSFTFPLTVSTTANNMVFAQSYQVSLTSTSATYGAVPMTLIYQHNIGGTQNGQYDCLWYLYGAPTGTNNFVINTSSSIGMYGMGASYVGVKQSPPEAYASTTASSTQMTATSTSISANAWSTMPIRNSTGVGGTALNGSTSLWSAVNANGGGWADSGQALVNPGQDVLGITYAQDSNNKAGEMVIFAPYVAPSAPAPVLRRANGQKSRL